MSEELIEKQKILQFNDIKVNDSRRFMVNSLSKLVNNFAKVTHKIKCKHRHDYKKYEACRIRCNNCDCFLEYRNLKMC